MAARSARWCANCYRGEPPRMTDALLQRRLRWPSRRNLFLALLFFGTTGLAAIALLAPLAARPTTLNLQVGDAAPQDILAPRSITYDSEVLTALQRDAAAEAVPAEYAAPEASVARRQVGRLRAALTFIANVRADTFATREQKLSDLAALADLRLDAELAETLIDLTDTGWQTVQQESIVVLEQLMRSTVREDQLEDARHSVLALVSLSLPEDQAALVAELVAAFVAPNSFYSEELTEARREEVRAAIPTVQRTYVANEVVIRRGQVVTETHLEALRELGLIREQARWQEQVSTLTLLGVCMIYMALYLRNRRKLLEDTRRLLVMAILFLIYLYGSRLLLPNRTIIPYLFPVASYSLLVTSLFSAQAGLAFGIPLSVLVAFGLPYSLDLTLYYIFTSLLGMLLLQRAERISAFFRAGTAASLAGMAVVLAFRLPDPGTDALGLITLLGAAVLYGMGSASLALILQFILAQMLGFTTSLQLLEISRPDHPLLQFILHNAPGTYQHSLLIANLSEQAAELIEADALLTRVGALYHDAGKARFPHFFIENQVPGSRNPHDDLDPLESSKTIIRHVPDGVELARKHRLPQRIIDFIVEHHGTMVTQYQYAKAVEAAGGDKSKVDAKAFMYPGPRPHSRETALVMLADGCEARTRAERPEDEHALHDLIKSVVDRRVGLGELDNTDLTMHDLKIIIESFTVTLRGVYHPRIVYPDIDEPLKADDTP
ncbi:MAG: HDIG domain-containing protein [Anaerolineae bacterium]|nr:MAG: HDIG domain-containing protein [Anaerolineae bacterium]